MTDIPAIEPPDGKLGVCGHGPCTCSTGSDMFCSEACEAAVGSETEPQPEESCPCTHDDCGGH